MTLLARFSFTPGQLAAGFVSIKGPIAIAATLAVRDAAAFGKQVFRAQIAASGLGLKWQNAARTRVYPKGNRASIDAAALLYHKIPYAGVFEDGATILPTFGPLLWLPLPNVPVISGGRRLPASKYFDVVGSPLYTIKRPGKPPLLGANVRMTDRRASKAISLSLLKRGRNPGGRGTVRLVPLYVGVPIATDPKKFDIVAAANAGRARLAEFYLTHISSGT